MCSKINPEDHLGLVKAISLRFINRGVDFDDIYQIGCVGLLKAAEKYNETLGYKFSTYAFNVISGEIKMFLRNNSMIKISRKLKDIYFVCVKAQNEYMTEKGRSPTITELSEITGIDKADILDAYDANSNYLSIYDKTNDDRYIVDFLVENKNNNLTESFEFEDMISLLDEKSKTVLRLRIKYDKTQTEISKIMNLSQVQISRIEKAAINKLKSVFLSEKY